jgi:hypothetical protein
MRRIRALLAAGLDPPMHSTLLQEEIEQAPFCFMSQQATAKFGEDREIKARIGQFQTSHLFPINAGAHGIGGLPVCESLPILHEGDQGQSPWSLGWLPTARKQILEIFILG